MRLLIRQLELEKLLTSFQKPQLQSVSIFFKFVHPFLLLNLLLSLPLFTLSSYFYVSLSLVVFPTVFDKFRDTAPFSYKADFLQVLTVKNFLKNQTNT